VVQLCTDDNHRNTSPGTDKSDCAMPTTTAHDAASPAANSSDEATGAKEKKGRKGLSLGLKSPFKLGLGGKTQCKVCKKKCSGEVLRVGDAYYHQSCFVCKGCKDQLSQGGFFVKDNDNFCVKCYQSRFGTKCAKCGHFVEGEVVTAMGNTYHTQCFVCGSCGKPFPTGERVTFTGKMCLCQQCMWKAGDKSHAKDKTSGKDTAAQPVSNGHKQKTKHPEKPPLNGSSAHKKKTTAAPAHDDDTCAGCGEQLTDGQALMALDKNYHVWW
jgi:actin-binding LIM protein